MSLSPEGGAVGDGWARGENAEATGSAARELLPQIDGNAVEPAERGEEGRHEDEDESVSGRRLCGGGGDANEGRNCGRGGEDDGDDELLWEPALDGRAAQMHQDEIGGGDGEDEHVSTAGGGEHVKENEPGEKSADGHGDTGDNGPVADIEQMAIAEPGGVRVKSVEDAVGDID